MGWERTLSLAFSSLLTKALPFLRGKLAPPLVVLMDPLSLLGRERKESTIALFQDLALLWGE